MVLTWTHISLTVLGHIGHSVMGKTLVITSPNKIITAATEDSDTTKLLLGMGYLDANAGVADTVLEKIPLKLLMLGITLCCGWNTDDGQDLYVTRCQYTTLGCTFSRY